MHPAALASLLLADPGWLELRWPEVAGCPPAAEVAAAAERLAAVGERRPVAAEAAITVDDTGYSLALSVQTSDGVQQRSVRNARCEPLGDATAVIVAVAAEPAGSGTSRPARDDEIPPGLRRTPPPDVRAPPAVGAFVAVVGAVGPPRWPAPGLQAGLLVLWPRARLELRFHHTFAAPLRLEWMPAAGAELQLSAAAARGCPRWTQRAWSLHLCGGLEIGALTARGFGFTDNARSTGLWAAGLVGPGGQWRPRRRLALGADVEAVVAFTRRGYTAAGESALLYQVPPVGLRFGVSLAVFFF